MNEPAKSAVFQTADRSVKTADGFDNFAARLGVGNAQNVLSAGTYEFDLVTRNRTKLEAAYRGSWIVGQVVDSVAEDMTRAGVQITTNEDAEGVTKIQAALSKLQIWQSLCDNTKWSRLYGGSIAVLQIKGQKLDTPLDLETVGKGQFQGLSVYDRWQLTPDLQRLIESGPDMGLPAYYNIVLGSNLNDPAKTATGQVTVHHTRCIRSIGIQLPFWQAITEMMWGESVLERLWDRLISFDTATMSSANLINRAQLRTVGVDGLREILAAGGKAQEALVRQFEYMREFQTNEGLTLIDALDKFETTAYSFAGLSDMMLQFGQQLAGASGIPLIRLFGQAPAGLNSTGDADIRMYYDKINAQQEANLRNPFEVVLKVLWRSLFGKPAPQDLEFTFTPLWQLNAIDQATVGKTKTDTAIEAFEAGGIDRATLMKELKQSATETGMFSHITDEAIQDAEGEEPPGLADIPQAAEEKDPGAPDNKSTTGTGDSAWKKIKKWLGPKK